MSIWMIFCLLVVVYFEKETIDRIGTKIYARLKFELNYWLIRRSIQKKAEEWR